MAKEESGFSKVINKFYGGIVRDDKSKIIGSASNIEELDIFNNENFIQAEQIVSDYTLPATSRVYAYANGDDDTLYAYGDRSDTTAGTVRIFSVAAGGGSNPSTLSTLFTSAETTNLAAAVSDFKFFRTAEASNPTSVYYIRGASTTWYLSRYNIGAAAEQIWNGSAWASGATNAASALTGLNGTFMRPTMKIIFGDLYICNGRFIDKVARDSTFSYNSTLSTHAYTLPQEWEAVDIEPVGDAAVILCRNKAINKNETRAFWWNLVSTSAFEDQFTIPMGGPQWIRSVKEQVTILCAQNGVAKFFRLSAAAKGAVPVEIPGVSLSNIQIETSTQAVSYPKTVSTKDKILYFGLWKTDKSGIYAIGQLDADKPNAVILSKRFGTGDYTLHSPYAVHIQGPNYYGAYSNNGTNTAVICKTLNSPSRSTTGTYESIWLDMDEPFKNKTMSEVNVALYPLPASSSVTASIACDYSASYTDINRADGTAITTTSQLVGKLTSRAFSNKKVYRVKLVLASATTSSPKVVAIGLQGTIAGETATQ